MAETRRARLRREFLNLPNVLTEIRILLIPLVLWLIMLDTPGYLFLAAILFAVASLTDLIDGYLARRQGLVTVLGKFLDPLADKLLVMSVLVVLVDLHRVPAWLVVIMLMRELAITGLRSLATTEGLVIASGKMGKYKTNLQIAGLLALIIHHPYQIDFFLFEAWVDFNVLGFWLLIIGLVLSVGSAMEYIKGFVDAVGGDDA